MVDGPGDVGDARRMLVTARCVLFDFDGPVCRLFPDGSSAPLAHTLREVADASGAGDLFTPDERESIDPHVVLRAVHRAGPGRGDLLALMEELLTAGERDAARSAWPTPHAVEFVRHLVDTGHRLAVVTNNSPRAAQLYLSAVGLSDLFETVQGRTSDPGLMKPHPDVVHRALVRLGVGPADALMIGDSGSDVRAARAAGVAFVGYGRDERKVRGLREADAPVVVTSYLPLLQGD
ncbi:HAD-IA family hydrolase [Streptomyces sp. NPDC052109]|uniref:HAD family hydrolase n=1 Tax=Streptomyces sp. NPDC052109 TaxID=3155527 RepID=UPI00343B20CD